MLQKCHQNALCQRQTQLASRSVSTTKAGYRALNVSCSYYRNDDGERRQYDRSNGSGPSDGRPNNRSYDRAQGSYDRPQGTQRRARAPPRQTEATREIQERIRGAKAFQQLYDILQTCQETLDPYHIVAMLVKVGKGEVSGPQTEVEQAQYEELIALLYGWVAIQAENYNPFQVATAIYSIGKLNYFNAEIVSALTDKAYRTLAQFKPVEMANTVWAFARMAVHPGEPWLKQLEFRSKSKLPEFGGIELSNTITSLSRLRYRPSDEWLALFAAQAMQQLPRMKRTDVTNVLWGMATLGYHPGQEVVQQMLEVLEAQLASSRVAELVKCMFALTQYEYKPSEEFIAAYLSSFTGQMRYVNGQDLAIVLYSMAFLQVKPAEQKLQYLVSNVLRKLDSMSGDNLADVAVALATMQVRPTRNWCEDFEVALGSKLDQCSDDALAKVEGALEVLTGSVRAQDIASQAQKLLQERAAMAPMEEQSVEVPAEAVTV